MKKQFLYILFILLPSLALPQSILDSTNVLYNICPFECCQYGEWIIQETIQVYSIEGDTNSYSFQLSNNDTISTLNGNLHFSQIGKVAVNKKFLDFEPLDTLDVYNCTEGEFLVTKKGKKYYTEIFWSRNYKSEEFSTTVEQNYFGEMIIQPKCVWWIKFQSKKGDGWIRLENKELYCFSIDEKILGLDGCR